MKYWNGEGQYQDLFDKHWKNLVPESGRADTPEGNALRAIARINHDIFNNGAGNIVDQAKRWMMMTASTTQSTKLSDGGRNCSMTSTDYSGLDVDRLKRKIIEYVQYDKDYGLSDLMDDYIDHIVLKVDNQLVTK
jgi:hypothetical protein